jgi:thioredoxin 1
VKGEPITLTDENFDDMIKKSEVIVVDFWAPWCFPCLMMSPIVDMLAKEYAGKVTFGKLNVDENRQKAGEYGVMSIPTLMIFKRGKLVEKLVGAISKEGLKSTIDRVLSG